MKNGKLSLFEGYGVELEYMIVDQETLAVAPIADQLIHAETGTFDDVERGPIAWSNELVLHVIELKTNGPAADLAPLPELFGKDIRHINELLGAHRAQLLPTGMHPFMDPDKETKLWPHGYSEVYEAFNRVFDCRGHGWSNLQSAHLNLPFAGDDEFGRLHAAIRLVLPLLPALAASSPMMDGRLQGTLDSRLQVYRNNAIRIPSVSGQVIPEAAYSRKEYEMNILARIYQDLAAHDAETTLQHEWVNARGAIARFDRDAIEIRLLDTQECPRADLAIAAAIVAVLRAQVAERWLPLAAQKAWPTPALAQLLRSVIVTGPDTVIADPKFAQAFGYPSAVPCKVGELWQHLLETVWPSASPEAQPWREPLATILKEGPLAQRIVRALGRDTSREHVKEVYRRLCGCVAEGTMFAA